jgi:hypothetical protein
MKIKITREVIAAKKEAANQANKGGWELSDNPMIRHHFNPTQVSRGTYMWLGIRALHKRSGRGTEDFHRAYALG